MKKSNGKKKRHHIWISAGIGFVVGLAIFGLEGRVDLHNITSSIKAVMPYLYIVSLISGTIGLAGYLYFKSKLKKDNYSNEEGSFYERNEKLMGITLMCATLTAVINFTAFGVNMFNGGVLTALFLVNAILALIGETGHIKLIRLVRPELDADPASANFNREYYDRLDECEKNKVGKASMKTITAMMFVYIGLFLTCYVVTALLNISPVVCLPIGIIWAMQTILYTYYTSKESK